MNQLACAALAMIIVLPVPAAALQSPDTQPHAGAHQHSVAANSPEVEDFLARARAAGERYVNRREAIADGYRRLGPDFPSMGEHWIQPARMVAGEIDPNLPQALSYIVIDGKPVLGGVIYAKLLERGESAPDFPAGASAWHEHSGTVDEEVAVLQHSIVGDPVDSGVRLAMLHVWLLPNETETFQTENWALPFLRLRLSPPEKFEPAAAKALSLAAGGDDYYILLYSLLTEPGPEDAAIAEGLIREAREEVVRRLDSRQGPTSVPDADTLLFLENVWIRLWENVELQVSPKGARGLHMLTADID